MPYLMNCLSHPITVQARGSWFSFTPEQIKMIHDPVLAHILVTKKASEGIVEVPEALMESRLEKPEEFKAEIEELRKKGVAVRIQKLEGVISNLEISLRRDLEMKNIKADPLNFASKGEESAYAELSELKSNHRNKLETPADRIRKIKEQMNGPANVSHSGAPAQGSPAVSKAAKS